MLYSCQIYVLLVFVLVQIINFKKAEKIILELFILGPLGGSSYFRVGCLYSITWDRCGIVAHLLCAQVASCFQDTCVQLQLPYVEGPYVVVLIVSRTL